MKDNYLFIIYMLIKISIEINYCDKSQQCNCTFCHKDKKEEDICSCNFQNGYCLYENGIYFYKDFLYYYDGCLENNGNNTYIYGESNIALDNGYKIINFISTNSSSLLCYYNFINLGSQNNSISIRLQRTNIGHPAFYIFLVIYDINKSVISHTYKNITSNNFELINLNIKEISLY